MGDFEYGKIDGVEYAYNKGDIVTFTFNGDEYTAEIIGFVKFVSDLPTYRFQIEDKAMYIREHDIIEQVE